ncbi:MAG: hypothetical protein KJ051_07385 [Thermoleophilia bacterium]|nr:hypothetical protein [Thermoleophilia bacterium]
MKRRRKRKGLLTPPGPGRNLALRPGGGPHRPQAEKRARDRLRRELGEQGLDANEKPDRQPPG